MTPDEPFPTHAYLPGHRARPTPLPPEARALDLERWAEAPSYVRGVALFNAGYYWEAHETWEGLWHACKRRGPAADLLKGLIKLAAAGVKARLGRERAARSLARGAAGAFRGVGLERAGGFVLSGLIGFAEEVADWRGVRAGDAEQRVEVIFARKLEPREESG